MTDWDPEKFYDHFQNLTNLVLVSNLPALQTS